MDKVEKQKITISAPETTDRGIVKWLQAMLEEAMDVGYMGPLGAIPGRLSSVAGDLSNLLKSIQSKINYLELVQTHRPEDLTTLIQEDLPLLREIEKSTQHFLETISAYFEPLQQSQERYERLSSQISALESSAPKMG